jgi:hypothetical protein
MNNWFWVVILLVEAVLYWYARWHPMIRVTRPKKREEGVRWIFWE